MEILDSQGNILINCQFSRHSSMQPLSPVLLLVENTRGLGRGRSGGQGGGKKVIYFSPNVHVCFNYPSWDTSLHCCAFSLLLEVLFLTARFILSVVSRFVLCFVFLLLCFEGVGTISMAIRLSIYYSPFGKGQTACNLKEPKVHVFFLPPASWGQSWCCWG